MLIVVVAAIAIIAIAGMTFARMPDRRKERMASLGSSFSTNPALESRLERLEQAVDTIAIEMERMGEGQRFITKLLADRAAAEQLRERPAGASARVTTPH